MKGRLRNARCSFCGKHQDQVRKLVAGPGVFICDQCVALCNEVVAEDVTPPPAPTTSRRWRWKLFRPRPPLMRLARLRLGA